MTPTFVAENVIALLRAEHDVGRRALGDADALTNAAWPFISAVADHGFDAAAAIACRPSSAASRRTRGTLINPMLAAHLGVPEVTL